MPAFKPVATDKKGNFYIKFEDPKKTTDFYGQTLTEQEVFRRHGCLPDNGILANKLINAVGSNLLSLEKRSRVLADNKYVSDDRKNNEQFNLKLEKECGANTSGLLSILAPLEQARFGDQEDKAAAIKKVTEELEAHHNNRIAYLQGMLADATPIQQDRINRLIDLYNKDKIELLNSVKVHCLESTGINLQTMYRGVMDRFSDEQRLISIYQGVTANQSATEAYQEASYAMEKHVFSFDKPTDAQLWQFDANQTDPILIDTRRYPSMNKAEALWSSELITGGEEAKLGTYRKKIQDVKDASLARKRYEKTQSKVVSNEIDREMTSTEAKPINSMKDLRDLFTAEAIKRKEEAGKSEQNVQTESSDKDAQNDLDFTKGTSRLSPEQALTLYRANDVLSAFGCALADFGKYFESKMAATHPAMAGAFFLLSSVTFGAAGLAAMHVAMAKAAMHHLPVALKGAVEAVSKEWLNLTYSNGNIFHVMIMDMFALPKVSYLTFDALLNGFEDKDTLTKLCERLVPESLEGKERAEKVQEMMVKVAAASAVLGAAVAMGLGASYVAAHGAGLAKTVADGVNFVVDIPTEAFAAIPAASGIGAHVVAIAAAVLTVKSAGLLIGKGMLLVNHMVDENTPDNERDALMIAAQLYDYASQKTPEEFNTFMSEHPLSEDIKKNISLALDRHPEVRTQFGQAFFGGIGVKDVSRFRKVLNVGGAIAGGFMSSFIDPVFDVLSLIGSPFTALLARFIWNKEKKSYGEILGNVAAPGLKRLLDFGVGIIKMLIGIGAGAKFVSIAAYGSLQRAVTGMVDAVMDIRLAVNAGIPAGLNILKKPFLVAGRYFTQVVSLLGFPGSWLYGAARGLLPGNKFTQSVTDAHNSMSRGRANAVEYFKNKSKDVDYKLLEKAPDAQSITKSRDDVVKAVHDTFDKFKQKAGDAVYLIRTVFLRLAEGKVQSVHHKKDAETASILPPASSTNNMSMLMGAPDPEKLEQNDHDEEVLSSRLDSSNGQSEASEPINANGAHEEVVVVEPPEEGQRHQNLPH